MEQKPPTFISVIIPTRNRPRMLLDALAGLEAQTYPPDAFEVFVMDNQSTDDTEAAVRAFAARAPFRVHYHRMETDAGPVPARNLAATRARGKLLAFTDDDCRPSLTWLDRGAAAFTDGVSMAGGPITYKSEQKAGFFSKLTAETLVEHPTYPTANVWYLKEVFHAFGGFDERLSFRDPFSRASECADADLAWRLIETGRQKVFIPDMWVYHEIMAMTPMAWLIEPTKIFSLPALIRVHPQLRWRLLSYGVVFYKGSIPYYAAAAAAIPIAILDWRWLMLAPLLVLVRAVRRAESFRPGAYARAVGQVGFNVVRNYVLCLTMIYGSLRFRSLVL